MTAHRTRIRARLVSGLDDAGAIETRSIDQVRAELRDMGVDPEASIKLAQKLAERAADADPAGRLLRQTAFAEDADAEIAALESAPIEEIRAALPPGAGASIQPADRDHAPDPSSSVIPARRRRHLSALGWSGSLIGVAASILLFVALGPDILQQTSLQEPTLETGPRVTVEAESSDASDASDAAASFRIEEHARSSASAVDRRQAIPSAEGARDVAERPSPVIAEEDLAAGQPGERVHAEPAPSIASPTPRPPDLAADVAAKASQARPESLASMTAVTPDVLDLSPSFGNVIGILIADDRAPAAWKATAGSLPDPRLEERLDEARRQASGRKVVALVAFLRDGQRHEAALVERSDRLTLADETAVGRAALMQEERSADAAPAPVFDLIELPPSP